MKQQLTLGSLFDGIGGWQLAARYKAIGNGMAQPCADFVLRRIVEASVKEVRK